MGQPPHQPPNDPPRGWLVGLIVAVVVALGVIIAGLVVLTGGDDDTRVTGGETSASDESSEDVEPTQDPSNPAGETSADGRMTGEGYSYQLLDDWFDITADILADNPEGAINTVSSWGPSIEEGRANVIVERQPAATDDPDDIRASWEANLGDAVGVEPESGDDIEIAGERALSATLTSTNPKGVAILQQAHLTVVDDAVYSITLSAEKGDLEAEEAFEEILDSWEW